MAYAAGAAIGVGIAAGAGAAAAAVRAAKQRAQPRQQVYGSQDTTYMDDPQLAEKRRVVANQAKSLVQQLGPRPTDARFARQWDAAREQILREAGAKDQEILNNRTVVDQTGYERATQPLETMQQQGAQVYGATLQGQGQLLGSAEQMRTDALGRASTAAQDQGQFAVGQQAVENQGMGILAGYRPGEASRLAGQAALDQNAQANLGAARSGGALGLRNALNANAQAGVASSGQIAAQRAAEEERYLGARVDQSNNDRMALLDQRNTEQAMALQADEAYRQRVLASQNANYGLAAGALNTQAGVLDSQQAAAVQREQLAAAGLDSIRGQQLQAEVDYDTRRQQEQQRKSNRLWDLAGGLLGISGAALGSMGKK